MESENTAGAETPEVAPKETHSLKHLGELLQESEPQEADDAGAPEKTAKPAKPSKFNDLAETLGLELDELYKLEISQAEDGSPVTVENLKDYYAKQTDVGLREIEFEERQAERETQLLQAQTELRELLAALPEKAVKPEVLQRIRDKHEAQVKIERQRTLEVIPDWQDSDRREADVRGMVAHLQQYGYPENYLSQVVDHKQIKYIRDNWQREQRIRKALSLVKAGKPNPTTPQKPATKGGAKQTVTGVKRGNARNNLEAVFSNLK